MLALCATCVFYDGVLKAFKLYLRGSHNSALQITRTAEDMKVISVKNICFHDGYYNGQYYYPVRENVPRSALLFATIEGYIFSGNIAIPN